MWQTARHTILFFIVSVLMCMLPTGSSALQPNTIYGANADVTPPSTFIIPCTTLGYSVDATGSFTAFGDTPVLNQAVVEHTRRDERIGYDVTRNNTNSTEVWAYAYNAATMGLLSSTQLQVFGQLDYGNRVVAVYNNALYLVRVVNAGRLGCTALRRCMSLSRVTQDGTFTQGTPIDLVTSDIFGLDDVSIDTDGTTYVAFASATGRRLAILSANSLSLIGFGPDFAINGSGKFATVQEGTPFIYIGYQDASRTVQVFAKGTTTPLITSSFAFSGINVQQALTVATSQNAVVGLSSTVGGTPANMQYRDATTFSTISSMQSYPLASDGSASTGGSYYDSVNNKIHTFRTDGGGGNPSIIRNTFSTSALTIEERFSCGTPCNSGLFRAYDFSPSTLRLYVGSISGTTITNTRIKICATGGPSAG